MSLDVVTALFLIVVPILFNVAFFELGRVFDYPDILRREPDEILRRFHAGGTGLLLRWHLLMLTALAMVPLVVLLAVRPGRLARTDHGDDRRRRRGGAAAGARPAPLAVRRPGAGPPLGRGGRDGALDADRRDTPLDRGDVRRPPSLPRRGRRRAPRLPADRRVDAPRRGLDRHHDGAIPAWLGWIGVPIGLALVVGSAEFAGPNERDGWRLAGIIVPIAYIAWSIWLIALGVSMLL